MGCVWSTAQHHVALRKQDSSSHAFPSRSQGSSCESHVQSLACSLQSTSLSRKASFEGSHNSPRATLAFDVRVAPLWSTDPRGTKLAASPRQGIKQYSDVNAADACNLRSEVTDVKHAASHDVTAKRRSLGAALNKSRSLHNAAQSRAELTALVNRQGLLLPCASRRLSDLSSASIAFSLKGKVVVAPDDGSEPFTLMHVVGAGACGKVYQAWYNEQMAAVKVVEGGPPSNEQDLQEQRQQQMEGLLLSLLSHPNIIETYKVCSQTELVDTEGDPCEAQDPRLVQQQADGSSKVFGGSYRLFIVMELCPLGSLWSALLRGAFHTQLQPAATTAQPLPTSPRGPTTAAAAAAVVAVVSVPGPGTPCGAVDAACHAPERQAASTLSSRTMAVQDRGMRKLLSLKSGVIRPLQQQQPSEDAVIQWDAWAALETLKEVASALAYMHERGVVHGDVKAANVLMARSRDDRRGFTAKVTDLGFSRVIPRDAVRTRTFATVTHMPPELVMDGTLTFACDVYSFGMLMWEMFTAQPVFGNMLDGEVLAAVVLKQQRPAFPPDAPQAYRALAQRCWAGQAASRHSMAQVVSELEGLQRLLTPEGPTSSRICVRAHDPRSRRRSLSMSARPVPDTYPTFTNRDPSLATAATATAAATARNDEAYAATMAAAADDGAGLSSKAKIDADFASPAAAVGAMGGILAAFASQPGATGGALEHAQAVPYSPGVMFAAQSGLAMAAGKPRVREEQEHATGAAPAAAPLLAPSANRAQSQRQHLRPSPPPVPEAGVAVRSAQWAPPKRKSESFDALMVPYLAVACSPYHTAARLAQLGECPL